MLEVADTVPAPTPDARPFRAVGPVPAATPRADGDGRPEARRKAGTSPRSRSPAW